MEKERHGEDPYIGRCMEKCAGFGWRLRLRGRRVRKIETLRRFNYVSRDLNMGTRPNYSVTPKRMKTNDPMGTTPSDTKAKEKQLKKEAKEGAGSKP